MVKAGKSVNHSVLICKLMWMGSFNVYRIITNDYETISLYVEGCHHLPIHISTNSCDWLWEDRLFAHKSIQVISLLLLPGMWQQMATDFILSHRSIVIVITQGLCSPPPHSCWKQNSGHRRNWILCPFDTVASTNRWHSSFPAVWYSWEEALVVVPDP